LEFDFSLFKNNLLVNKYLPLNLNGKRKQKIPKKINQFYLIF